MKTILVVEDETDLAESIQILLGRKGYRVLLAYDGREGLAKAIAEEPDLVLTDLMMPIMDGRELIARLGANPATRRIPVVAMSASHDAQRGGVLRKPFGTQELVRRVRHALGER